MSSAAGELSVSTWPSRTKRPSIADPELPLALELPHRQRVEEFVGDDEQRIAVRQGGEAVVPARGEPLGLGGAQDGAGLDQLDRRRQPGAAHRPQRILGQGAAPGPQLDIMRRHRAARAAPQVGEPDADQLAEHLADLGRGDEIAVRAERIAGRVIMRVRLGHIIGDLDRAFGGDAGPQPGLKRPLAHRRRPGRRGRRASSR
jgi:hypothetical protein